jgi:hypothetical protein
MTLDAPTLEALTSVAGATILILPITEIIKRAINLSGPMQDRWMPVISMLVGIGVVLIADFGLGLVARADLVSGIVTGMFAGFASCGLYDTYRGFAKTSG